MTSVCACPGFQRFSIRTCAVAALTYVAAAVSSPLGLPGQTLLVSDGTNTVYPVEGGFLVPGTDSVFLAGRLLDTSDYTLDYDQGLLILHTRVPVLTPIVVRYHHVRFSRQPEKFRLNELPSSDPPATAATVESPEPDTPGPAGESGVDLSGSKTLGVSFGGEGAGIDQATNVALSGAVEGVLVSAELSDQSSPIPAEGTTRDLQELDKLLVSLKGRGWQGAFGDVDLGLAAGGFGSVRRRATGGLASCELEVGSLPLALAAGYATPRGRFGRVELTGSDGVQGPYVLAPDGMSAQVIPGSEQVFLDGRRMVRGWDADYTLDYATGELLFTNRHIVDRFSRIEATFQFAAGNYQRATLSGSAGLMPGQMDFTVGVFREGDDPASNYVDDLSEEQRAFLGSIGTDTARAWVDGSQYVGAGHGDYLKSKDHFVYAGRDSGDYQVRFGLAGDSLGDYVYDDSLLAYSYVGPAAGNYVSSVKVALPGRDEAAYARLAWGRDGRAQGAGSSGRSAAGRFFADAEGAFRRHNVNLFAGRGGALEAGALGLAAGWQDSLYGITFNHRGQGRGFELAGVRPAPDFTYRWGGAKESQRRMSDEVSVRARPLRFLDVAAEAGRLVRFDTGSTWLYKARAGLGWTNYEFTRVADITRHDVRVAPDTRWLHPRAGWRAELRPSERVHTWTGGLGFGKRGTPEGAAGDEGWGLAVDGRLTEVSGIDSAAEWQEVSLGRLAQVNGSWVRPGLARVEAMAGWNDTRFPQVPEQDWNQLFGTASGFVTPGSGFRLQTDYSQTYRLVQLRDETFKYVGPEQGQYRRDSVTGQYLPDPKGDYERITLATGRYTAVREWTLNGSAEVTRLKPATLTASFSQTQTADSAVLTDISRQDARLVLRAAEPYASPALGLTRDHSLDRTLAATGKSTRALRAYAEAYSDFLPGVEGRVRLAVSEKLRILNSGQTDYREQGWQAEAGPVLGRGLRLELELLYGRKLIEEPVSYPELGRFWLASARAGLARSLGLGARTRVRASAGATYRAAGVTELPFDVGLAEPLGWNPEAGLSLEQTLSDILTGSARYTFSDREDRPADHRFAAELKAYF